MRYGLIWTLCMAVAMTAGASREVDETKSVEADAEIEIVIVSGSIEVTGWNRNEIRVEGTLGDDIEEFIFEVDEDEAKIEAKPPKNKRRKRNAEVRAVLKISVPSGSSLEIRAVSAPITVTDVHGDSHEIRTVSGKILIDDCSGELEVNVVSGSIEVDGDHDSVEAGTVSGRVTIRGVSDSVEVETVSGSISISAGSLRRCDIEVLSGKIHYEGALTADGRLDVEAFSGTVHLDFTEPVYGRYDIETFSGGITCDFGPEPKRQSRFTPGRTLKFTHGDGDARVSVETFSGKVIIEEP